MFKNKDMEKVLTVLQRKSDDLMQARNDVLVQQQRVLDARLAILVELARTAEGKGSDDAVKFDINRRAIQTNLELLAAREGEEKAQKEYREFERAFDLLYLELSPPEMSARFVGPAEPE